MYDLNFPLRDWLTNNEDTQINLASSSISGIELSEVCDIKSSFSLGYNEELDKEIKNKIKRIYGDKVYVIPVPGAQIANSLIYQSLFDKGDEIIVESPTYLPLITIPKMIGLNVKILKRNYEDGFKIDSEMIHKEISENTKAVVITNPHNPSGVFIENNELKSIQEYLEEREIYLIVDEIYRDFIKGSSSSLELGGNVIVTTSLSKVYGMGGLRIGWIASKDKTSINELLKMKYHMNMLNSTLSEKVALSVLEERNRLLEKAQKLAENNLAMVEGWINGIDGIDWIKPSQGIISSPKLSLNCNSFEFAKKALEYGVLVAPGRFFTEYEEFDKNIRLTFGTGLKSLAVGLQRLTMVINEWK